MKVNFEGKSYNFPDDASDEEITTFLSGGDATPSPEPKPSVSLGETTVGEDFTMDVPPKEVVRPVAQMAIGAPAWLGGSPIAGGAAAALVGAGVDLLYGDMPDSEQVATDAALGMALPGGAALASKGVQRLAGKAAVSLYQRAAKYPTTLKMADKTRVSLMGLRERILFNPKSLEKLGNLNDELTGVADEAMIYAQMRGEGVSTKGVKDSFWNVTNRMKKDPIFDKRISEGIQGTYGKMIDELPPYMSPQEVIAWRRSLNQQMSGYFDRMKKAGLTGGDSALMKAKESVRASVNKEIIGMVPELKALGQRQKDIIDLLSYSERATSRISNWDVLGLGSLVVGDIMADAAGVSPGTKVGALGGAAAGMLAWRIAGSPNAKARIAFMLAKVGKLDTASKSTLELIGLTRDAARNLTPKMKALPFPKTMPSGKPETVSGIRSTEDVVHAESVPDVYEQAWRKYAYESEQLAQGGQFPIVPKAPRSRGAEEAQLGPFVGRQVEGDLSRYDQVHYSYLGDMVSGKRPKGFLGIPYEELAPGIKFKGKLLK